MRWVTLISSVRLILAMASVCAWLALSTSAAADELVVDHNAPGVQVSGPWTSPPASGSVAVSRGPAGSDSLSRPAGAGDATVFWPFPATASPGHYEAFARWTSDADRATNALYFVTSDAGTVTVAENQQLHGGVWQSLGSFDFQSAKDEGVTLSDRSNGVVIADAVRWVGPVGQPAAPQATGAVTAPQVPAVVTAPLAPAIDQTAAWTVTIQPTELHAGPETGTDVLASIPQFSYLQVLGYSGDWAYVYNPRAHGTAYLPSAVLGPSDPPPAWVTAPLPAPGVSIEKMGRTVGSARVAFYPVDDKFAYVASLGHNVPIMIHDQLTTADGSTWYRTDQGYLPAAAVRLPRPPVRTYPGRWIDADLTEPAMLTAYDGDRMILDTLAIKGTIANQTPTGTFTIQRRVADETMDSGTLGIPADGPGGYHLEHVLFTQYFSSDGASIHFNYWSSNFGYSGSHGCLGVDRADSEYLWNWATIGTPVVIHS